MFKFLLGGGWKLFGGLYLGWGIGANDSANIFSTAVATNSIRFRTAVTLISIFAIIGSYVGGPAVMNHLSFTDQHGSESAALIATFSAAIAITVVTFMAVPASCSQAAIGGMMGSAIYNSGFGSVDWAKLGKMFLCWFLTPIGSALIAVILFVVFGKLINRYIRQPLLLDRIYRWLLIIAGSYGAYSLGANNVAVTTASYYHTGMFGSVADPWSAKRACLVGGSAIALGALTYSKKVMQTVGSSITVMSPFGAVVTIFAHSITLEIFTRMHIPVSSSQAIVGAVMGIGFLKGSQTMQWKTLGFIFLGWMMTPVSGAIAAFVLSWMFL